MTAGLLGSVALHLAVVGLAVVGLPRLSEPPPIAPVFSVELVSVDQLAEAAAQSEAELAGVPEVPQAELAESPPEAAEPPPLPEAAPTPPPEPAAPPEPEPTPPAADAVPLPEPTPEPEPAPEPEVAAVEPETPEPAPEPEPPATEAQPAEPEQALLADVTPPVPQRRPQVAERPEPEPELEPEPEAEPEPEPEEPPQDRLQSVLRNVLQNQEEPEPRQTQQAARPGPGNALPSSAEVNQLGQIIQNKMAYCWRFDPGARNAEDFLVVMNIELTREGFLIGEPRFEDPGRLNSDRFYRAAAENARRAILECAPYTELPQSQYEVWRSIRLRFDPRQMLGG